MLGYQDLIELGGAMTKVSQYIMDEQWVLPNSLNVEVNRVEVEIKELEIPKSSHFEDSLDSLGHRRVHFQICLSCFADSAFRDGMDKNCLASNNYS